MEDVMLLPLFACVARNEAEVGIPADARAMPDRSGCTSEVRMASLVDAAVASTTVERFDAEERLVEQQYASADGFSTSSLLEYDVTGCIVSAAYTYNGSAYGYTASCDAMGNPIAEVGTYSDGRTYEITTEYVYDGALVLEARAHHFVADTWHTDLLEVNTYEGELPRTQASYIDGALDSSADWTWVDGLLSRYAFTMVGDELSTYQTDYAYDDVGRVTSEEIAFAGVDYVVSYARTWMVDRFHVERLERATVSGDERTDDYAVDWTCTGEFPWTCDGLQTEGEDRSLDGFTASYTETWTCD